MEGIVALLEYLRSKFDLHFFFVKLLEDAGHEEVVDGDVMIVDVFRVNLEVKLEVNMERMMMLKRLMMLVLKKLKIVKKKTEREKRKERDRKKRRRGEKLN